MPSPKSRGGALSPAAKYYLLTGIFPHRHICGAFDHQRWTCEVDDTLPPCAGTRPIEGATGLFFLTPIELRYTWEAHAETLRAEARRYGFVPAGVDRDGTVTALDAAMTADWRRDFMRQYGRRQTTTDDSTTTERRARRFS